MSFWYKKYPKQVPQAIQPEIYRSIDELFEQTVSRFQKAPAFTNMNHTLSFFETKKHVDAFASFCQNELKLQKGDRIAIQCPNLIQVPICIFGALKAGLVIVNTNPLYTPREMKLQFIDAGVKAIVILSHFAHHLEEILPETQIEHIILTEIGDLFPTPKKQLIHFVVKFLKKLIPKYNLPHAVSFEQALKKGRTRPFQGFSLQPEDLAFLQYTGGTTGLSKGAMLTHRNIIANTEQIHAWLQPKLRPNHEIIISALPLYHIFCLTVNLFSYFKIGAHNILITNPKDIHSLMKDLRKYPFTFISGVNTLMNVLTQNADFQKIDFSNLHLSIAGGMALHSSVAERWKKITSSPLIEGYGLTEASPVVTCNPVDGTEVSGSIGLPLPSTEVQLRSDEGLVVPIGENGELWVRGPQVMKGYWNQPEETKKVLTLDGWLKTGDIAQFNPDGFLKIVDRKKDMILISGFNVYPNEIEDVISTHAKVSEVAIVGLSDSQLNETVKAFIVKKDPTLTEEEILHFCRENLTPYKVPKHIEFRSELPKSNVGKILKRILKEQ